MNNRKDKDAFLKSIIGTSPIRNSNTIKRDLKKNLILKNTKQLKKNKTNNQIAEKKPVVLKSGQFKIEKIKINKKLKQGSIKIDKKIDFHGFSLFDAENLFIHTIKDCYNKNMRCLLFVTGKGILKKKDNHQDVERLYYGKIRNNFTLWVNNKDLKSYILGFEQAGLDRGADGAFLVYLRKKKLIFD